MVQGINNAIREVGMPQRPSITSTLRRSSICLLFLAQFALGGIFTLLPPHKGTVLGLSPKLAAPAVFAGCADAPSDESTTSSNERPRPPRIPPILFLLFSTGAVEGAGASPLNPQPLRMNCPFFQGWLVRTIDHDNKRSFIFIVGSFAAPTARRRMSPAFTEHYVFFSAVDCGEEVCHEELFPDPLTVQISGSAPGRPNLFVPSTAALNVTWVAQGRGKFTFTEAACTADFTLESGTRLHFESSERAPWSRDDPIKGPEGWLGYTSLLPCHYFVHSTGSACRYSIAIPSRGGELRGKGWSHIEGNHGTFFPEGWVWSQAISAENKESYSLVVGKFDIGFFRPLSVVLYLRTQSGPRVFRTTDLDDIIVQELDKSGKVRLTAVSRVDKYKVELVISAPRRSFGKPVYVPTAHGFSCEPGAKESYIAVAIAKCFSFNAEVSAHELVDELVFELSCLEFGNSFCLATA